MEFDFMKCQKCGRLCTKLEIDRGLGKGEICPCGSLKYAPVNLIWWQWMLPRVWWFACLRMRGVA